MSVGETVLKPCPFCGGEAKERYECLNGVCVQQAGRRLLGIGHDDDGRLQLDDALNVALHSVCIGIVGQVGDFVLTQHLNALGTNVVEVIHQIRARARCAHGLFLKLAFNRTLASHPQPVEFALLSLKKNLGGDGAGLHGEHGVGG